MSFIPSFILSSLFFFNVSVPAGWNGATLTEGIICEVPGFQGELSVQEQPAPSLKNATILFHKDGVPIKMAAGNLTLSGINGTTRLSASLPSRTDSSKAPSLFVSWQNIALAATGGRITGQFHPGYFRILADASFKAELKDTLSAGWTHLDESKDDSWYLRFPWHREGNLLWINNILNARFVFQKASLEAEIPFRLSVPDILVPAASSGLKLLLKAGRTETTLSLEATPSHFLVPSGSYTPDTFQTDASFSMKADAGGSSEKSGASLILKAEAGFVQKQPAEAKKTARQFLSALVSCSYECGGFGAGFSVSAAKLCLKDRCADGELTPSLNLSLDKADFAAKATVLPFRTAAGKEAEAPAWSLKAEYAEKGFSAAYTAEFEGACLKKQDFSLSEERGRALIGTSVSIAAEKLVWNFSFSLAW